MALRPIRPLSPSLQDAYPAVSSTVMIEPPQLPDSQPMTASEKAPQIRERLRLLTMLLALSTGILLVAQLWQAPLTEALLTGAGRGVIFILLTLGLMGTQRLSLILTALVCASSLPEVLAVNTHFRLTLWLELPTLILCMGLLLTSTQTQPARELP